ncbi:MAG: transporter [Rhizobacter sp.]|nr:transporter [Rhizobacter sp.]
MQQDSEDQAPTRAQWRMVAILCLVNAVAFIDRTALPLLVQPIKRDLGISDTQMSLLIGAAFIVTYALGGALVGLLVDKFSRRRILAGGIGLWGAATIFCGTASSFMTLFLGRCGVGAGEAACGPSSMSLIRDTFSPRFRGRAVAIWAMGAGLGGGCALLAGGTILHMVGESGSVSLPLLGVVQGWQLVLLACGAISIPVALLVFTFPEPKRSGLQGGASTGSTSAMSNLRDRWPVFVPLFIANAATIMLWTGYSAWIPALMGRTWKIPAGEIGLILGLIVLVLSTSSQFIAGFLTDITRRRHGLAAVPLLGAAISACVMVPAYLIPHAQSAFATWCLIAVFNLGASSLFTVGTATVVHLSPTAAVGKITGLHFAWVGITGSAVAPTLIALVADKGYGGGPDALGNALSSISGLLAMVGCIGLWVVWRQLRRGLVPVSEGSQADVRLAAALPAARSSNVRL